jgi:SAM-dependent methyltransferase
VSRRADEAAFWDAEAEAYARVRRPSEVDRVTLARVPPEGDVLELGAGPGIFTRQALAHPARARGGRFVVSDISPRFCAMLAALPVVVRRCDHRALDLPPAALDTAYAMATLHHLPAADCGGLLTRLARWLRPGGRLALVEDWAFSPADEAEGRLLALRRALCAHDAAGETHPGEAEWCLRLGRAGFAVVHREQVPRAEALSRYDVLADARSREHLAWLRERGGETRVPMTLLVARSAAL